MNIEISNNTKNALTKTEALIRNLPERFQKELCDSLKDKLSNPHSYIFRSETSSVINAFHKICSLYDPLCEVDKEQFKNSFISLAEQFS